MSNRINKAKSVSLAIASVVLVSVAPARAYDRTNLSFSVTATGIISPKCTLTQDATTGTFPDVLNAGTTSTLTLTFTMFCNKAYTATLYSLNGGLKFDKTTAKGFGDLLPYTATLNLFGASALICKDALSKNTGSATKPTSNCSVSVTDSKAYAGKGSVVLNVAAGTGALMAGNYKDTLTLQLTPNV